MVFVPGGKMMMGTSAADGKDGESPTRAVTLQPFKIDKYPVTNSDFRYLLLQILAQNLLCPPTACISSYWPDTTASVHSREFVRQQKYKTEAEKFGWSFVFQDFVSDELKSKVTQKIEV